MSAITSTEFSVSAQYSYVGHSFLTFEGGPASEMGGYGVARLAADLAGRNWRLQIYLDNLLDERGNTFAFGNPFMTAPQAARGSRRQMRAVRVEKRGLGRKGRSAVIDAFLERRPDLVRFFTLRLGSAAAAEDLVQEMYLRLATVEPDAEIGNPTGYLYRVGTNLMLQRIRGDRRSAARDAAWRQVHHQQVGETDVVDAAAADDAVAARQRLAAVIRAVEQLPAQTQRVFRLHKLEGLTHTEVAARLGISRSAVEKHMIAVLKHLAVRS